MRVAVLCLVSAIAAAQTTPTIPIAIDQARIARSGGSELPPEIEITVRNTGAATIVAWGVVGEARYSNGQVNRIGVGTDTYDTPQAPKPLLPPDPTRRMPPGGIATMITSASSVPLATVSGVTVLPEFAIFEDDTAVGDEAAIARAFERRRMNLRVWRIADETFTSALARGLSEDQAFEATLQALAAAGDDVRTSMAAAIFRMIPGRHPPGKSPSAQAYAHLRTEVARRRAAAERHAERRR